MKHLGILHLALDADYEFPVNFLRSVRSINFVNSKTNGSRCFAAFFFIFPTLKKAKYILNLFRSVYISHKTGKLEMEQIELTFKLVDVTNEI